MPKQLQLAGGEFVGRWRDTLALCAGVCARNKRAKIFFATFFSEKAAPTLLAGLSRAINLTTKTDYWLASSVRGGEKGGAKLRFGLFQSGHDAWTAFTLTKTVANEDALLRLLRLLSPNFSEAYLTSSDIRSIFEALEERAGVKVSVNKAVAYSHRREGQISFFKNEAYHTVFNKAENEGKFVDKVDFSLTGPHFLHGFVARNGGAKFMAGDIELFQDSILSPIAQISSNKHGVFRASSRQPGSTEVSAIDIQFGETAFQGREDDLAFISSLDRMARSGIAVLHENPYVHVSLIDFFDGSAFDIFATSRKAVTIVPQVGASPFSLNRLCNHIFENFREGMIAKPEEKVWTLEEVLA
jgi:hypothetical protein